MRGKITGKEQGKCPVCVRAAQSCVSSGQRRALLPLGDIRVAHGFHMVPQRDHRYGYFRLFDPRAQDELNIGPLRYGARVSAQVPLVNYSPRENHWRPAPLRPGEDQKYLEHDYSRRLPPPTGMSAKHVKAWGLEPEGEVENWTPVIRVPSPDPAPSAQAGPSRPKRKAASPPRKQPARKRRAVNTTPRAPSPAPSAPVAPRRPAPGGLFRPLYVLETLSAPDMPLKLQQGLVNKHFEQLLLSAGIIKSSIGSWNNHVRELREMGERLGFRVPLEEIQVVSRSDAVEWEDTPVDPNDRKGKKPARRPRVKKGKKSPSEIPESDEDGPEDPNHGKSSGEGGGSDGGHGGMAV
jgi:hypothetical protein